MNQVATEGEDAIVPLLIKRPIAPLPVRLSTFEPPPFGELPLQPRPQIAQVAGADTDDQQHKGPQPQHGLEGQAPVSLQHEIEEYPVQHHRQQGSQQARPQAEQPGGDDDGKTGQGSDLRRVVVVQEEEQQTVEHVGDQNQPQPRAMGAGMQRWGVRHSVRQLL